jgi:hypothetical protein
VQAGVPRTLLELRPPDLPFLRNTFTVAPDGRGIVALEAAGGGDTRIRVRSGWRAAL